jgi:hypothetical protein
MILIYNENVKGQKEFVEGIYNDYAEGKYNFKDTNRVKDDEIVQFVKLFSYTDDSMQIVKDQSNASCLSSYIDHVRNNFKFSIDRVNKVLY